MGKSESGSKSKSLRTLVAGLTGAARAAAGPRVDRARDTLFIRSFALARIPLIFYIAPTVLELSENRVEIRVPLSYRTRNHLGSMYFGALCIGADCAGGVIAMKLGRARSKRFSLAFKDLTASFLKRADGDVHFVCEQGREIRELVERAVSSGERQNLPVDVVALVPKKYGEEPVARFTLTLSVKG